MLYLVLALLAIIAALIFVIKAHESDVLIMRDPEEEKEIASEGLDDAKKGLNKANDTTSELAKVVTDSKISEQAVITKSESKKTELRQAQTSKVKDYLKSEGYHVEEIFPED